MIGEFVGAWLVGAGVVFSALGVFGLYRMPDVYTRIHAGAKVIAIGSAFALLGLAILSPYEIALRAIAVLIFLYLTTPIATHATARAAHRRKEPMTKETVMDELASRPEEEMR